MKRLFTLFLLVLFFLATPVFASEDAPTYEVKIKITYNAVSATEAVKIVDSMIDKHGSACVVEYNVKKNVLDGTAFIFSDGHHYYSIPNRDLVIGSWETWESSSGDVDFPVE